MNISVICILLSYPPSSLKMSCPFRNILKNFSTYIIYMLRQILLLNHTVSKSLESKIPFYFYLEANIFQILQIF